MPESEAGRARFERAFSRASSVPLRAPQFDLRVDADGARLRLARPLTTRYGRVESCHLDLGRLPAPVDLRLGALGFRGRRRRLRSARLWLRADALESWAAQRGVELHVDGARAEVAHLTLVDEQGALGFELRACGVAGDLHFGVDALRTRSGAEEPRARLGRVALRLGLTEAHRLERPLFWLLAQAFSEVGQRAPEATELPVVRVRPGDGGFWLSAGEEPGEPLEEPRWAALWPGASEPSELGTLPETLRLEQAFQTALARGDARAIAEAVSSMLTTDPSRRLAAEAAHLGAPFCPPPVAAGLLARAASLVTDDPVALARAAEAAPEA
ncbi:MAG: hypothetical protein GXP55_11215, partial [Deltaproteobacteria bacterium]|nr:hypothetical protein [Deltaproteobacteria bacterium]